MRPRTFIALAIAVASWAASPCLAQGASLPKDLLEAKTSLTSSQRQTLSEFAAGVGKVFAQGDPAAVVSARNELIETCRNINASDIFRRDLSVELVKQFEPLTKSTETFRATNAFLVTQFLRTQEALDFLLDNIEPSTQPDAGLRAAAAAQLPKLAPRVNLVPAQVDALAKRLANSARTETNWMAVASEIEAVSELLATRLPSAQADSVAAAQASIINSVTERIQAGGAPELLRALQRGLLVVRNQLTVPQVPGRQLLDGIAPSLLAIEKMKQKPLPQIAENPQLEAAYNSVVVTAELLQKLAGGR